MNRIPLTENLKLAEATAGGVLLGEAVREAGLDPEVYLAVIPGNCGRAGRLNLNGRIYALEAAINAHEALCREAKGTGTFGERDHPEEGPTWDVVSRFLGGSTRIEKDGSAIFEGRFGILNSSLGRDLIVLWRAGVPIGMSLRAEGIVEKHTLDEKSPYRKMNPGFEGKTINLISEARFLGYDHVRTPSAETYLPGPLQEAATRLRDAQKKKEAPMGFKNFAALREAHPGDAEAIRNEIVAEAVAPIQAQLQAEKVRADKAVAELTEAKAAALGMGDKLTEIQTLLKEERQARTAAETKAKVVEALDGWMAGRHNGARIKSFVLKENVASPEAAVERANMLAELMADAAKTPGDPSKIAESKDSGGSKAQASGKATTDLVAAL